ncbi:MAG: hypothetical protein IT350_05740 [Deltaproteobacteria bacterium]|nr:hypothetical protein [Deltaproteobacteria bacterium]
MPDIFAQSLAKPLVLVHALAGFVAAATAIHLAVHATTGLRRGAFPARGRTYAVVMASAFAVCVATGLAAYPSFRVHIRGLFLDRFAPAMTAVFEIKEHLGALVVPFVALALILERAARTERSAHSAKLFVTTAWIAAATLAACVVMGLVVTMERGV